jgi:glycosyltransferase involved in cell wall biosynthesis
VSALSASVVVSTYNRPEHLERCLEGFRVQSRQDFEVLIADDGSGPETRQAIERAARDYPVPLRHIWHEDQGFRKCAALNRAVEAAQADYIIFTDSDCVPHRHYVANHLRHREPGVFLVGRSVKWGPGRTSRIDVEDVRNGRHTKIGIRDVIENRQKKGRYLPQGIYLPGSVGHWLGQRLKTNLGARGGNLSVWKADLERINGWNEDFESWGLEDVELGMRLRLAGVEARSISHRALTFHLWHPEGDKKSRSARTAYNESKARAEAWCPNGLVKADAPPQRAEPERR